jgi:hypothetical protein
MAWSGIEHKYRRYHDLHDSKHEVWINSCINPHYTAVNQEPSALYGNCQLIDDSSIFVL